MSAQYVWIDDDNQAELFDSLDELKERLKEVLEEGDNGDVEYWEVYRLGDKYSVSTNVEIVVENENTPF